MGIVINNVRQLRRPVAPTAPAARRLVNWNAVLTTGQTKIACTILNISSQGAKLRLHDTLPLYVPKVWLITDFLGPLPAKPTWAMNGLLGLSFLSDAPIIRRLELLLTESRSTPPAPGRATGDDAYR